MGLLLYLYVTVPELNYLRGKADLLEAKQRVGHLNLPLLRPTRATAHRSRQRTSRPPTTRDADSVFGFGPNSGTFSASGGFSNVVNVTSATNRKGIWAAPRRLQLRVRCRRQRDQL
jgi:hypothetical protein